MPERDCPSGTGLIAEIEASELTPTSLQTLYRDGASVIVLDLGDWVSQIWQRLIETTAEVLPWQLPLADIAANHYGSPDITKTLGDVAYFQPGQHGYIGRKIEVGLDDAGAVRSQPCHFQQNGSTASPPGEVMTECWNLANKIMRALAPAGWGGGKYSVAIQRLKYQAGAKEFTAMADLTRNSLARWSRLGYHVDVNRGTLHHRLSGRWVSDALGVMMTLPVGRSVAKRVNDALLRGAARETVDQRTVVERPHTDHRYFSALCGNRQSIRTEFFARGEWHEVPVGLNRLTIIPGTLAKQQFHIEPLLHRVIYPKSMEGAAVDLRTGNVTLLLGAA